MSFRDGGHSRLDAVGGQHAGSVEGVRGELQRGGVAAAEGGGEEAVQGGGGGVQLRGCVGVAGGGPLGLTGEGELGAGNPLECIAEGGEAVDQAGRGDYPSLMVQERHLRH